MTQARKTDRAARGGISPILLGNCPQLAELDTRSLVRLSRLARSRLAFSGETIYSRGDDAASVYLLLDGAVRLERSNADGTRTRYTVEAPYATFGDVVLLGERERRYTAEAVADAIVVELPLQELVEILSRNAPQALAWRSAVLARLHRKEPGQADNFGWKLLNKLSELFEAA